MYVCVCMSVYRNISFREKENYINDLFLLLFSSLSHFFLCVIHSNDEVSER